MKKFATVLLVCLCLFSLNSHAQISKKEAKALKAELKKMMKNPGAYKAIKEELNVLRSEASIKNRELSALRKQVENAQANAEKSSATANAQIETLKKQLAEKEEFKSTDVGPCGDDYTKGVVYKVQVGAFTKKTYEKKIDGSFWEEDADGTKKYTIGYFRDYLEADKFKKYLREIGVSDAWIVAYEDNQRKDIKTLLDKE